MVWVSDWGANAILRFDPKTEKFEAFPLPDRYAGVRQLAGRKGSLGSRIGGRQALRAEGRVEDGALRRDLEPGTAGPPGGSGLVMSTLCYAEEVRSAKFSAKAKSEAGPEMAAVAETIIERRSVRRAGELPRPLSGRAARACRAEPKDWRKRRARWPNRRRSSI
jgi:hypothetical protein